MPHGKRTKRKNKNGRKIFYSEQNLTSGATLLNVLDSGDILQASKLLKVDYSFSQTELDQALLSACHHGLKYVVQTLVGLGANVAFKDTQGSTPLMISAGNGFIEIVRFLLMKNADVNVVNSAGDTALILSIRPSGSSEMVKVLLAQKGIDITHQNRDGYTALMKAIEVMDIGTIKILMDKYSKTNETTVSYLYSRYVYKHSGVWDILSQIVNSKGETTEQIAQKYGLVNLLKIFQNIKVLPLVTAVNTSDIESFNILLDCQFLDKEEMKRPVNEAFGQVFRKCEMKEVTTIVDKDNIMITRLLDCGVDLDIIGHGSSAPLPVAVKAGNCTIVELLCKHVDQHSRHGDKNKIEALTNAAEIGRCDIVELLLRYNTDVNYFRYSGSPLDCALRHGHLECAKLLIQHGANLDIKNALESAVKHQVPKYVDFLFDGFKPEIVTFSRADVEYFSNLLISAAKGGSLEIIGYLLDTGADINVETSRGQTALSESKNGEVVKYLVNRGADVNLVTRRKNTPLLNVVLDSPRRCSSILEIVQVLLECGACVNGKGENGRTVLIVAASRSDNAQILKLLLDHGADISQQDEDGSTALMEAVGTGCPTNVSCLLQSTTDKEHLNLQNKKGLTALMSAVDSVETNVVKKLLDHGADVNIKDLKGSTVLLHSVTLGCRRDPNIIRILVGAGSDVNSQNNDGLSPLMLAAKMCRNDTITVLLEAGANVNDVSKMDKTKTAISFLTDTYFDSASLLCMTALLERGARASYLQPVSLHKLICQNKTDTILQMIRCGVAPADISQDTWLSKLLYLRGISTVSPLCVALQAGNVSLARHFVEIGYLTKSDMTLVIGNMNLRRVLEGKKLQECLDFLDELSSQPLSLLTLALVTVSSAVGTSPGREDRVDMLPLPQMIKDRLLFKSEVVTLASPTSFNYKIFLDNYLVSVSSHYYDSDRDSDDEIYIDYDSDFDYYNSDTD